ncbi:hypothetical protein [Gordonia sp. CPCC 205333]|uniref:hypothetical protein n=1 Tax=Gordonia sp. CPCC 205333 TaxID=3140790 RepID=UPI003AF3B89F
MIDEHLTKGEVITVDLNLFEALMFWVAILAIWTVWIWLPAGVLVLGWVSLKRYRNRKSLDHDTDARFACLAATKSLWCWLVVVVMTTLFGNDQFGLLVWISCAVMAAGSLVAGTLLIVSRWSTRSVGLTVVMLGLVQATRTYFYFVAPTLATDDVSPPIIDSLTVVLLCLATAILMVTEPPWPVRAGALRVGGQRVAEASDGPNEGM